MSTEHFPAFLIVGTQKGGTFSLYEYLNQHPDVLPSVDKELAFFDLMYVNNDINWYKRQFPEREENLLSGEASPNNMFHPHVPNRVYKHLPNVKLIFLLRNPVERAFSHYQMEINRDHENLSFEEAIRHERKRVKPERKKIYENPATYSELYSHFYHSYLMRGKYIDQIKRWMQFFPKEQMLFVKSEDLFEYTNETYQNVLKFLNIPNYILKDKKVRNKGRYSISMGSWIRYELNKYFSTYNESLSIFLNKDFNWS